LSRDLQDGVSVIIITHDEAPRIPDCLRSVQWAREIIVVDGGSTDGTPDICRDFGARVFEEDWKGYAAQKNSALDKASQPWVLSLDADERVTGESAEEMRRVLGGPNPARGYSIPRKNYFAGRRIRYGGWYPDRSVRLFQRGAGRFEERAVHERVRVDGVVGTLRHPLLHYTYSGISDFLRRADRYSSLSAEEYARQGRPTGPLRMLGHSLFTFLQMYVLKLGFLDGYHGFLLACLYSHYTFVKYAKLKERTSGALAPGNPPAGR